MHNNRCGECGAKQHGSLAMVFELCARCPGESRLGFGYRAPETKWVSRARRLPLAKNVRRWNSQPPLTQDLPPVDENSHSFGGRPGGGAIRPAPVRTARRRSADARWRAPGCDHRSTGTGPPPAMCPSVDARAHRVAEAGPIRGVWACPRTRSPRCPDIDHHDHEAGWPKESYRQAAGAASNHGGAGDLRGRPQVTQRHVYGREPPRRAAAGQQRRPGRSPACVACTRLVGSYLAACAESDEIVLTEMISSFTVTGGNIQQAAPVTIAR